jgi:hypothetical protein
VVLPVHPCRPTTSHDWYIVIHIRATHLRGPTNSWNHYKIGWRGCSAFTTWQSMTTRSMAPRQTQFIRSGRRLYGRATILSWQGLAQMNGRAHDQKSTAQSKRYCLQSRAVCTCIVAVYSINCSATKLCADDPWTILSYTCTPMHLVILVETVIVGVITGELCQLFPR